MSQEITIYLVNLIIGAMLALLMTQHWRRDGQANGLRYWTIAAWTLAVADLLFALRPSLPFWAGHFFPTLRVTVGHGVLLLASGPPTDRCTGTWRCSSRPCTRSCSVHSLRSHQSRTGARWSVA